MPKPITALSLCALCAITSISVAKPLNLVPDPEPIFAPTAAPPSLAAASTNLSIHILECFKKTEKPALAWDQCREALTLSDFARLPPGKTLVFEPRDSPLWPLDIGLPRRYQSSDGGCAIDLSLQPFATAARNTPREINIATDQLIEKCVMRSPDKAGGRTKGFGGDGSLILSVAALSPKIDCYGSVDRQTMISSCNNLANQMSVTTEILSFGTGDSRGSKAVQLPYHEEDPAGGGCGLRVFLIHNDPESFESSSWYTIWEAVVAINAMCIRNGQRGRRLGMGDSLEKFGMIIVDVGGARVQGQNASTAAAATA